ncbi:MAG: PhnD/SsuA/transferrin family substrate-binding protein [Roseovarius sp.]
MIASLPMYDRPETRAANERYWQAIRAELGFGPEGLTHGGDLWAHWEAPDLLFSQTCGYPYRARLHGHVTLVGTPDYGLEGCGPGEYCSVFVVRADDPRTELADFAAARFAYNEPLSQSGWAAPQNHAAGLGFAFSNTQQTGGHRFSAEAVAEGRADIAAIDALTWRMIRRYDGFAADLRELAHTAPTPVLPYITRKGQPPEPLFAAIEAAIARLDEDTRQTLCLEGLVAIPAEAYLAIPNPPAPAS